MGDYSPPRSLGEHHNRRWERSSAVHRGRTLPEGMTPECLDRLARIINAHANGETDELDAECAVRIFEVCRGIRA
jgi:hypothetical protein